MAVGERMSGWVAAGQAMINADAALDLFDVDATSLRSALAIALPGADDDRLVISLYSARPGAFSSLHQRLIEGALPFVHSRRDTMGEVVDIAGDRSVGRRRQPARPLRTRHECNRSLELTDHAIC